MPRTFQREKALGILIDAYLIGDVAALAKYGISSRTIWQWRQRLASDPDFRAEFQKRQAAISLAWMEYAPRALVSSLQCIQRIADEGPGNLGAESSVPAFVAALAGAMNTISKMTIAQKYSDIKIKALLRQLDVPIDQPAYLADVPQQLTDGGYTNGHAVIDIEPSEAN
jgi:hypothetical protein